MRNSYEVPIVLYHSINDCQASKLLGFLYFSTPKFASHLRYYRDAGFECVTLTDLHRRALNGEVGNTKLAVLTYDDGFLDNYLIVVDIPTDYDVRGTIFVNPEHARSGPARSRQEMPDAWGYLNFEEMQLLEKSRILETRSYTQSREDVFTFSGLQEKYSLGIR